MIWTAKGAILFFFPGAMPSIKGVPGMKRSEELDFDKNRSCLKNRIFLQAKKLRIRFSLRVGLEAKTTPSPAGLKSILF